eukprot:CAMPEP_0194406494 /NCGR_PEP_ID=MMETSP0176-20130528/4687_1 /TAXON_ID=216777 /ORGANISM="Proboscia alata, Strain PI-D3" /LENGTH=306 /DNA_ID=CAMNT_0039205731 /DNA_START=142 /DNA_END=1062 /DNA_ORIENTATION=-
MELPEYTSEETNPVANSGLAEKANEIKQKTSERTASSSDSRYDEFEDKTDSKRKWFTQEKIILPEPSKAAEAVNILRLKQKHLRRLKRKFVSVDVDGSGSIDAEEFFQVLDEPKSPFADALFRFIDLDGSGTIEFEEFVRVCVTYCIYSKEAILKFCFDCFDVDKSGSIDEDEYIELCRSVNCAAPLFPGNFGSALEMVDSNNDGQIDFTEFLELNRRFPMILFPAFRLQDRMQKLTLGAKTWTKIHENIEKAVRLKKYIDKHSGMKPRQNIFQKQIQLLRAHFDFGIQPIDPKSLRKINEFGCHY